MGQKTCRFGVATKDGFRGTSWSLKVHEKSSGEVETYLYARALGGKVKTSFHDTGRCHTGFTKEYHDKLKERLLDRSVSRHVEEWRIDGKAIGGVTVVYHIVTPPGAIRYDSEPLPSGYVSIPPPDPGKMRLTTLFMFEPGATANFKGENLMQVCEFKVQNGRSICLFSADIPLVTFPVQTSQVRIAEGEKRKFLASEKLRAIAYSDFDGWGYRARTMVEFAVEPKKPVGQKILEPVRQAIRRVFSFANGIT